MRHHPPCIASLCPNTISCPNHPPRRRVPAASSAILVFLSAAAKGYRAVGCQFLGTLSAHAPGGTVPILGTADVHERSAPTYASGRPALDISNRYIHSEHVPPQVTAGCGSLRVSLLCRGCGRGDVRLHARLGYGALRIRHLTVSI